MPAELPRAVAPKHRLVVAAPEKLEYPRAFNQQPVAAEPVGPRHAVSPARPWRALCGRSTAGWHVFDERPFDPAHKAACLRCAQLTGGPGRRGPRASGTPDS